MKRSIIHSAWGADSSGVACINLNDNPQATHDFVMTFHGDFAQHFPLTESSNFIVKCFDDVIRCVMTQAPKKMRLARAESKPHTDYIMKDIQDMHCLHFLDKFKLMTMGHCWGEILLGVMGEVTKKIPPGKELFACYGFGYRNNCTVS